LELAAAQTSGDLFIGTGPRTSAGDINIGTGANLANNLYIGHKGNTISTQVVKINTSTGASIGSTVIGSATSGTNIIGNAGVGLNLTVTGSISANGGLTIGGANGITLTSSAYTPTTGQLGYVITGAVISSFTAATSGNTTSVSSIPLTTGTWIVCACRQFVSRSLTTGAWFGLGQTLKNNAAFASSDVEFGVVTPSLINDVGTYANLTGIVVLTAATTIYLNYNVTYTGTQPTVGGTFPLMKATRIG